MAASILTTTPSGAGFGVSTSSNRRSLWACKRQALWVFFIAVIPNQCRPGLEPGPTHRESGVARWTPIACHNKGLWLGVPAFAGTTRGEVGVIVSAIVALDFFRQFDHDAPAPEIDRRHHGVRKRQQHG